MQVETKATMVANLGADLRRARQAILELRGERDRLRADLQQVLALQRVYADGWHDALVEAERLKGQLQAAREAHSLPALVHPCREDADEHSA